MATQVPRAHVLANFRPSRAERLKAREQAARDKYRERPGNSKEHLSLITQLPCCVCGRAPPGTQYHHLKSGAAKAERGVGKKASDRWAIPLCYDHHLFGVEKRGSKRELTWFAEHGVDAEALAEALWRFTGNLFKMIAITKQYMGRGK